MKAWIKWLEGAAFLGESGSGPGIVPDGASKAGGRNLGARPMEAVLIGLGACSAFDVVAILDNGRQTFAGREVELAAARKGTALKVFTKIHLHFVLTGVGLDGDKVARAIRLSAKSTARPQPCLARTPRSPTKSRSSRAARGGGQDCHRIGRDKGCLVRHSPRFEALDLK